MTTVGVVGVVTVAGVSLRIAHFESWLQLLRKGTICELSPKLSCTSPGKSNGALNVTAGRTIDDEQATMFLVPLILLVSLGKV